MLIDWFTVSAQVVNFLVLVWLLKRFLYRPVLDAIDARRSAVDSQLAEAAEARANADQEREALAARLAELQRGRQDQLEKARQEAVAERVRLTESTRQEVEALRRRLEREMAADIAAREAELTACIRNEAFAVAEKVLTDLAATSLQSQMAAALVRRLHNLGPEDVAALKAGAAQDGLPAVRSNLPLAAPDRQAIDDALAELLGGGAQPTFAVDSDLALGLELTAGGYRLGWTAANYLDALQHRVREVVRTRPTAPIEAES